MAGEIAYKLTADEAQALQAVARLSREFGLNETAIKKATDAAKDLDRTQQQMGRDAAKIAEEIVQHLSSKIAAEVEVTLEIQARSLGRNACLAIGHPLRNGTAPIQAPCEGFHPPPT